MGALGLRTEDVGAHHVQRHSAHSAPSSSVLYSAPASLRAASRAPPGAAGPPSSRRLPPGGPPAMALFFANTLRFSRGRTLCSQWSRGTHVPPLLAVSLEGAGVGVYTEEGLPVGDAELAVGASEERWA